MIEARHTPVLVDTVIKYALPDIGKIFVDGTFGLGGHTKVVLSQYLGIEQVIGIDRDHDILSYSCEAVDDSRIQRIQAKASELPRILYQLEIEGVDGILLDLGVSSYQLENPERGFSFMRHGPLDMRMNRGQSTTAADLINNSGRDELVKIFQEYGEERFSGRIADAIVDKRTKSRIETTDQLAKIIGAAVPSRKNRQQIHPATRVFQAVRIAVNQELDEIKEFLDIALECLNPGGHLTIISFHSLEDRLVKNFMQDMQRGCICPKKFPVCICGNKPKVELLTKKAIFADEEEISLNPRARSARLRSCKKCT